MSGAPTPDPRSDVDPSAIDRADHRVEAQRAANDRVWRSGRFLADYATRGLRPAEVVVLAEYRDDLRGRVLELGCGAGRLTGYLVRLSASTTAIDIAPAMVDYCQKHYPGATFRVGDIRDVGHLEAGSFDAVVAGYNVIDVVGDADRAVILDGVHRTLATGGLLIFSSHNRAVADAIGRSGRFRDRSLAGMAESLVHFPRRLLNRRRLRPFEQRTDGYAILNDPAHDFGVLHYYIERDDQERQLERHGFELLACVDLDGRPVDRGQRAPWSSELHYVARRRP